MPSTKPFELFLDYPLQNPIDDTKRVMCVGIVLCFPKTKHCHLKMLSGNTIPNSHQQHSITKLSDEDKQIIYLLHSNLSNWIRAKQLPTKSTAKPWDKRFWSSVRKLVSERLIVSNWTEFYLNYKVDTEAKMAERIYYQQLGLTFNNN